MKPYALALSSLAALMLTATPAHARFGKRTPPKPPSGQAQAPAPAPRPQAPAGHAATPAVRPYSRGYVAVAPAPRYYYHRPAYVRPRGYIWFHSAQPVAPAYNPGVEAAPQAQSSSAPVQLTLNAEAGAFASGLSLGGGLFFEGERIGVAANYTHLLLAADDGGNAIDSIQLANFRVTAALLAGERGRLRLEGGLDGAVAPNLLTVGPSVGMSGVLWLAGPFALEGAINAVPFPFHQIDMRAGLGLGLGPVGLRAGWRTLILDDAGLVDGVAHTDVLSGPYVGAALVF